MENITPKENKRIIDTTIGPMTCKLVVYRDYIESNGYWRLFWQDGNTSCGFQDESTVTGQPFFKTMHQAIQRGIKKYNIVAERGHGYAGDID